MVISGSKIDVSATERQQPPPIAYETKNALWPHRTLEMTWAEFWGTIKENDGKRPAPVHEDEIKKRVTDAAAELNWGLEFIENEGIWLDDGDTEYFFQKYDLRQNAERAIALIRREVCYVADQCPDDPDCFSYTGMLALTDWPKPQQ